MFVGIRKGIAHASPHRLGAALARTGYGAGATALETGLAESPRPA
ncbi:hypothetical protein ACLN6N_00925 [Sphingomonas carotinifaciens]